MCHRATVADPRDPTGDAVLDVEYDVHLDPPDPSVGWLGYLEVEVHLALNKRDRCVLWQLTQPQQDELRAFVHRQHEED